MRKKVALILMFVLLGVLLTFHAMVLSGVIPYDIVWAGKLKSYDEMIRFETVSILINSLMLLVFVVKYRLLRSGRSNKIIDIIIWIFALLFLLNTVGNLFSKSTLELVLGSALTLVSAVLCVVIVRK
ncbi:MAG: hypothetical protein HWE22_04865 [Flavobacteriales bacterium]|nr:hypothetical protein [Flavobacteriales bacterium]